MSQNNRITIFLQRLKNAYNTDKIYCLVGKVIVAVNPYKPILSLYECDEMMEYRNKTVTDLAPHIYLIGNEAMIGMQTKNQSQSIIITGESGAGKTESMKQMLRYLSFLSGNDMDKKMNEANPILEGLGNAQTEKNINSSRYCKMFEVHYSYDFKVIGGEIKHFMFEKNRVSSENPFHIFRFIFGAPVHIKDALNLNDIKQPISNNEFLLEEFLRFDDALNCFGFDETRKMKIYRVIAGIIFLNTVQFEESQHIGCVIHEASLNALEQTSRHFSIGFSELKKILTTRLVRIPQENEEIQISLDMSSAVRMRNTISKSIYFALRDRIITEINGKMKHECPFKYIGILDIPGFECFQDNSLEQLLINFSNENLQRFCMEHLITDMNIEDTEPFPYSEPVIDLIGRKDKGILILLNDESKLQKPSVKNFTNNVFKMWQSCDVLTVPRGKIPDDGFAIRHFGGQVFYSTKDFIDKNTEFVPDSVLEIIQSVCCITEPSSYQFKLKQKFQSESVAFRSQINELLDILKKNGSNFIRCVSPNDQKLQGHFDESYVLCQLRNTGTLSLVANESNVLKLGDSVKHASLQMSIPTDSNKENENPDQSRFDASYHFPDLNCQKSAGRCKLCQKTTYVYCLKCKKNLCFVPGKKGRNCFTPYLFKSGKYPK